MGAGFGEDIFVGEYVFGRFVARFFGDTATEDVVGKFVDVGAARIYFEETVFVVVLECISAVVGDIAVIIVDVDDIRGS